MVAFIAPTLISAALFYPWEYAWNNNNGTLREGTPIEVDINFHRIFSVDDINSVADLIVWFRLQWVDPHLAWNPQDYNGTTNAWFWIGDGVGSGEASEIWTPDLELWNMAESLKDSLTDSYASVSSDGTVFWSRPGHLIPACKFSGLDSFPFDALSCTMEIGSWSYSGLYVRPVKFGGTGFSIGGSETAGESFAEYQLADENAVACREKVYPPFPGAPEEDWPVLLYDVTFYRSWEPYARGYIVIQVILNLAGFSAFWLPVTCGERMGLAITVMLAAIASELVVSANLPSASEMTWFQAFSLFSMAFGALALFESVAVIFFFYYTGSDLVPSWWKWIRSRSKERIKMYKHKLHQMENKKQTDNDEQSVHEDAVHNCAPENGMAVGLPVEGKEESYDDHHVTFQKGGMDRSTATSQQAGFNGHRRRERSNSMAARDADDFVDDLQAENNKKWKHASARIDEVCRVVIVTAYVIILAVLLQRTERK